MFQQWGGLKSVLKLDSDLPQWIQAESKRECLNKTIMPDCYLWTNPPGKPLLRRAGWCRAAPLLSHPLQTAQPTRGAHTSLVPTAEQAQWFPCPLCLWHCLQRGSGFLKSSYIGSQEETGWKEHFGIQSSLGSVTALEHMHRWRDPASHTNLLLSFRISDRAEQLSLYQIMDAKWMSDWI